MALAEGEINRRYDIIDGERFYMASPTDVATRRAVHRLGTLRRAELAEYGTVARVKSPTIVLPASLNPGSSAQTHKLSKCCV